MYNQITMKFSVTALLILTSLVIFVFVPFYTAEANTHSCPGDTQICNPLSSSSNIQTFIKNLLQGLIKIGLPVVALAIIYSGFLFVSARGNSEKLSKAKDTLLYTLIGAAILLGSWAIAQMISNTVLSF